MTFGDLVRRAAEKRRLALPAASHPEPLAALPYADERALKEEALVAFWREHRLGGDRDPLVAAPLPRGYRTTSKRRVQVQRHRLLLTFPGAPASEAGVAPSALDPPTHVAVYDAVASALVRPGARPLAGALNYVVVRGTAPLAVLFNVRVFDAAVVRGAKQLAEVVQKAGAASAFLFLDPSGSDYYLEARRPVGTLSFKRLFGPEWLDIAVDGLKLRFPPTVFSQVNGAMVPDMVKTAGALLDPRGGHVLLDLYCGYGLFALSAGRAALRVVGMDHDGPAVEAAAGNARHLRADARFIAARVTGDAIAQIRVPREPEIVLLDPPRQGTEPDVVPAIAARRPARVVHIACGIDEVPREVETWTKAGYRLQRAVPLDMFAGTFGIETLMLLVPAGR